MELLRRHREVDVLFMPYVFFPGFVFLLAAKLLGIPTVARISGQEVSPNKSMAAKLRFFTLQHVSAVVALNSMDAERLRNIGVSPKRIYHIPNGVDTERFRPVTKEEQRNAKRALGLSEDRFVVSFIGILCQRKGVLELLQAYHRFVLKAAPDSVLVLAGPCDESVQEVDREYVKKVRQQINQMDEHVRITGTIDCVPELLQASDSFVLPSYAEGMPNALLEAMATGLPCIATEIPGIEDLIDDEVDGLLVKPGDIDGLKAALHRLKTKSELRLSLGRAARRRIEEYCSVDATARQYIRLFQKVSSRHDQ
jgi:glycosyltransferase involved in cell wall biosynthesis